MALTAQDVHNEPDRELVRICQMILNRNIFASIEVKLQKYSRSGTLRPLYMLVNPL